MMKKKRVSKKNKVAWRKHVNINDVEEYLEEKRADERLGDPIEIQPDQKLFQIETKPLTVKNQKRKPLLYSTPRCFQILESSSKVPDPITKRNRVRTKEERKDRIVKSIEEDRRLHGIVKQKEKIAQLNRIQHKIKKKQNTYKRGEFKGDIWDVEDLKNTNDLFNEWNNNDTIRHNFQGLGKLRKETPKSLTKKKSLQPTIEFPHPGMSYNPSFNDHQDLLKVISEKEEKIIKDEMHIERVTTNLFNKLTPYKHEKSWLEEMSEGLTIPVVKEEPESDDEYKSVNPPVINKKKDVKQRRKEKQQRELEETRKQAKMEKKKTNDIYKLKMFNKQINKKESLQNKVKEKREMKKKEKQLQTKRLSSRKFEEPELEFNMGKDISGNLRKVKLEGNLLLDRFKSLQKRNILEPSALQFKKKGKVKKFDKASHKMDWESKKR